MRLFWIVRISDGQFCGLTFMGLSSLTALPANNVCLYLVKLSSLVSICWISSRDFIADAPQYKAPAMKSLEEIQQMDTNDESLTKYKQTLLAGSAVKDDNPINVRPQKLTIRYPDNPEQPHAVIDLTR